MDSKSVQLDRFLLRRSEFSLRQLRQLIVSGKALVDGNICTDIRQPVNAFTIVTLNEIVIQQRQARYLMLNKPAAVVSATSHPTHKTVIDCIEEPYATELHLAGRLDFNTTGLTILTNDGHWSRKLTQPQEKIPKTYLLETEQTITDEYTELFAEGMHFKYENITILPSILNLIDSHHARLTIYQGRYHQIKRMFGFFDNKVTALHRESMGGIYLDNDLQPGEYRRLSDNEVNILAWPIETDMRPVA